MLNNRRENAKRSPFPYVVSGKDREGVVLDLQLMQQRVHPTDRAVQQPERVAEQSAG